MRISIRRIRQRCIQFAEKQGFPLIVTVCVAVITASALWTGRQESPYVSPTPPVSRDVSAAQLLQESLRTAATATPAPTQEPARWNPPLKEFSVLRGFDAQTMQQSSVTGAWQIHAGTDLSARRGEPVYVMRHGTILSGGQDDLLGVWFRVAHDDVEALYAGMAAAGDFLAGDIVEAGDTLGFVGSGPLEEGDLGSHLHLETSRNGVPFDPLSLWHDD